MHICSSMIAGHERGVGGQKAGELDILTKEDMEK
jgi:hypothetical protein